MRHGLLNSKMWRVLIRCRNSMEAFVKGLVVALVFLGIIQTILQIGEERPPVTKVSAAIGFIFNFIVLLLIIKYL